MAFSSPERTLLVIPAHITGRIHGNGAHAPAGTLDGLIAEDNPECHAESGQQENQNSEQIGQHDAILTQPGFYCRRFFDPLLLAIAAYQIDRQLLFGGEAQGLGSAGHKQGRGPGIRYCRRGVQDCD